MKSLYDVTFSKMKYSSVRLLAAALCLVVTGFVIFASAMDWFTGIRGGKYIAIGAMAILFIAVIFMSIAVEKYPRFDEENEKFFGLRAKVLTPMYILILLYIIGIFAFDFTFDISRLFLPVLCVLGTVYEFYLYFRAKRPDAGEGGKGKQEVRK